MTKEDPLNALLGLAVCPVCGSFDRKGMYRCSECGTFHSGGIMEERQAPPPEEQMQQLTSNTPLDPTVYSVGPNAVIPEESFDESDDVTAWDGSSTDFSFDEEDEAPVAKMELPEPEVLNIDD